MDDNFDLGKLLDFAETYQRNEEFAGWVESAETLILNGLERMAPDDFLQHMYLVEEYV